MRCLLRVQGCGNIIDPEKGKACNKKLEDAGDGLKRCTRCENRVVEKFNWRALLRVCFR